MPGQTGTLISPDDIPAMRAAGQDLLSDRAALARMGQQARDHVLANFRLESEAAALIAIYRQLMDRPA